MPATPIPHSELTLRPLEARDLPALWRLHSDPRTFELDTIGPLDAVDQMQRVLITWIAAAESDGFGYRLVSRRSREVLPGSNEGGADACLPLGVAGLSRMPLGDEWVANVYVRFFPEAWGTGAARWALAACLGELAERPRPSKPAAAGTGQGRPAGSAPVDAAPEGAVPERAAFVTAEGNVPARKLAESLGFTLTTLEDPTEKDAHVVYCLSREQWGGLRP